MYNIVPKPKEVLVKNEKCNLSFPLKLNFADLPFISKESVLSVCYGAFTAGEKADVIFIFNPNENFEYRLIADEQSISVIYKTGEGVFNALVTLYQIYKNGKALMCFEISDAPDFKNRGFMLDISRGRVPKLETIKRLADILARFKYNQLQLYVEGFSFCYPSFEKYCNEDSALTVQEIKAVAGYCRERFIELVPNQNSLGHMTPWLAKEEFSHLAECEGGFSYGGFSIPPTTLDASDMASTQLIEKMTSDLLTCFDSDKIHMGLDEPFEMGRGKNSGADLSELFSGYVTGINAVCKKHGRKMMMWSDALHRFDCFGKNSPKDVTYLEWGYEKEYPFDERCKKLKSEGLDFYVCPGTSSWLSFCGITDNAVKNIDNAVRAAVKYSAKGVLLTDWGDCNHMQPLSVSYPAIVHCACAIWNYKNTVSAKQLEEALNLFVFEDSQSIMGSLATEAGNYHKYEEIQLPCRTLAHLFYSENIKSDEKYKQSLAFTAMLIKALALPEISNAYLPFKDEADNESIGKVLELIENLKNRLCNSDMNCIDADIVKAEYKTALDMVQLFTLCRKYISNNLPLSGLKNQAEEIAAQHKQNWLCRNKLSGLDNGLVPFYCFK